MAKVRCPCHKSISSLIPLGVCWELWINGNRGWHDNKSRLASQTILNVKANIRALLFNHQLLKKKEL